MPRLLLVDDNPSIHKIVASLLDSTAIEVLHANNAEDALKFMEDGAEFDVALVDTSLPNMDGWGLLEQLRSDARTEYRPIAMMAGVLEDVDLARIEKAPIQAFLRKPVDLRDLQDKVTALIAMPNMPAKVTLPPAEPEAQPAEPATPPAEPAEAPPPPEEPVILPDVPLQSAESAAPSEIQLQPADTARSDLLVLEAQDLAQEIALAVPDAIEGDEQPEEGAITIELEDLDLSKIDQLVAPTPYDDQPDSARGGQGSDPDNFLDTAPDNFLDTVPEDFGPEPELEDAHAGQHSPIANELLSDQEFIKAVAKEVAKNISLHDIDD
ncbi:MAG: response regulator [Holophagales bacterium]|jgi:CheY-like chemotaxis protein|nr:response regulator [Holophagales bacterium]